MKDFIENKLVEKIRKDQWEFKIGNERDLESSIYYYLREFLSNKDELYKISTNYTIKGTAIWKQGKGKWKKSKFIMPDILISRIPKSYKKPLEHKIAFELKTRSPGMPYSPNFTAEAYQKDFRKLNRLKTKKRIQQGYYFVVYSDPEVTEKSLKKEIEQSRFYYGKKPKYGKKPRQGILKRFKILLINRNVDPKTKKIISPSLAAKRQEKQQRQFRTYSGNDPRFVQKKSKNKNRGLSSKKANATIYKKARSRKYRLAHPDAPMVKKYINHHNLKR